jgi:flagella basal body P-ring formation protein FlgA
MKVCNFLYFFSLSLLSIGIQAKQYTHLGSLLEESKQYLQEKVYQDLPHEDHSAVNITSSGVDSRLKLHACDKPLTFQHRDSSKMKGTVSVKVSCNSPYAWSIYTKHKITLEKNIIVAKKHLTKNTILTATDLSFIQRDIYTQRTGYHLDTTSLIGKQLTRPLAKGAIIYQKQLTQAQMIKKGDNVSVVAKVGGLSVITTGTALSNGRIGEQIEVENKRSSRIIRAEITGKNSVEVIL